MIDAITIATIVLLTTISYLTLKQLSP